MSEIVDFQPLPKHYRFLNLTNHNFGKWKVLGFAGQAAKRHSYWFCQCACGIIKKVFAHDLASGKSKSCGCPTICMDLIEKYVDKDRLKNTLQIFFGARKRCTKPKCKEYIKYGARGIDFRFESFSEFLEEVGLRPSKKHSLHRINNDGHYEKGNIKWATDFEQQRNTRNVVRLTYKGETKTMKEWAIEKGIAYSTLQQRISKKWCVKCALELPGFYRCSHLT